MSSTTPRKYRDAFVARVRQTSIAQAEPVKDHVIVNSEEIKHPDHARANDPRMPARHYRPPALRNCR